MMRPTPADKNSPPSRDLLRQIPKVDLHCHLDGSLRVSTILDLGEKYKVKLPANNMEELKKFVQVPSNCRSLTDFLKCFEFFYEVLKSPDAMERISYELCEDSAKENIRYLEVRFAPSLQDSKKFSMEDSLRSVIWGLSEGEKKFSVGWGVILCIFRSHSIELAEKTVLLADRYRDQGVVAIDLAGDEAGYPVGQYQKAFQLANAKKIPITCHAGEADGPDSVQNAVRLGAQRIGHGIRVIEDEKIYKEMIRKQIPFEVCLTSNVQTRVVHEMRRHPLPKLYREGLYVTLNTDDPGVSAIDLTHEYWLAANVLGLSLRDCIQIIRNGIQALFLDDAEKKKIERELEKDLMRLKIS